MLVNGGFRVHALLWPNVPELRVGRRAVQLLGGRVSARIIADEVQMVPRRGSDAERLLYQAVWLIPVPIRSLLSSLVDVGLTAMRALWCPPCTRQGRYRRCITMSSAPTLALHFSIRQKAAGDPAGAP